MPRYVIERVYNEAVHDEMDKVGVRTKSIAAEHFPDITWEHSHVVSDESGDQELLCLRGSESGAPTRTRRKAGQSRDHPHLRDRRRRDAGGFPGLVLRADHAFAAALRAALGGI